MSPEVSSPTSPWLTRDRIQNIGRPGVKPKIDPISMIGGVTVLTVDELPTLVQAVGYLKYSSGGKTYLRGQADLHGGRMEATLLRGNVRRVERGKAINSLISSTSAWQCAHKDHKQVDCLEKLKQGPRSRQSLLSAGVPRFAAEPLLQHYGLQTRWLDVVDNLWIALWFACHWFDGVPGYRHPVKRTLHDGRQEYVYVVSVGLRGEATDIAPGVVKFAGRGRVTDLRESVPSYYLRPHAQHGLLIRPHEDDYLNLELAALRIPLAKALDWLGSSVLLSPFAMFPPPSIDVGYRRLLEAAHVVPSSSSLGSIDIYGAGQ